LVLLEKVFGQAGSDGGEDFILGVDVDDFSLDGNSVADGEAAVVEVIAGAVGDGESLSRRVRTHREERACDESESNEREDSVRLHVKAFLERMYSISVLRLLS
jgi:hypothetical protein